MNQHFILFSLGLFTFFSSTLGLSPVQSVQPFIMTNATTCPTCLVVKTSISIQNTFPWLFNNPNTRFFYNGFYVINDLETGYVESDGRVFIYNSDSDDCPDDTGRNWYYWVNNDWVWDESIYVQDCNTA